jgi:hypothetical protein
MIRPWGGPASQWPRTTLSYACADPMSPALAWALGCPRQIGALNVGPERRIIRFVSGIAIVIKVPRFVPTTMSRQRASAVALPTPGQGEPERGQRKGEFS